MKIFLSYASEDRAAAEEIALALQARGHEVFFDKSNLSGGEDFNTVIRQWVADAELFIFLITPASVRQGAYTLTELRMTREKWLHPRGHVLPVLLEPTDMQTIPAYLRGVTLFQAEGNVAAELAAHIKERRFPRWWGVSAVAIVVLVIVAGFGLPVVRTWFDGGEPAFTSKIAVADFVSRYVFPPEQIEATEYSLDPTSVFPNGGADMVALERVAFGVVSDSYPALNISLTISNVTGQPLLLDLTPRFFTLEDDRGRRAQLLYFCCEASGAMLGAGEQRQLQLIYKFLPDWQGKEITVQKIYFRVEGLLPLVRGVWVIPPLAVAD
jgi:hypothetical protein